MQKKITKADSIFSKIFLLTNKAINEKTPKKKKAVPICALVACVCSLITGIYALWLNKRPPAIKKKSHAAQPSFQLFSHQDTIKTRNGPSGWRIRVWEKYAAGYRDSDKTSRQRFRFQLRMHRRKLRYPDPQKIRTRENTYSNLIDNDFQLMYSSTY